MTTPLLSLRDLQIGFRRDGVITPAVTSLSLDIMPGETVALVGESGSGKSVSALASLGLLAGFHSGVFATFPAPHYTAAPSKRMSVVDNTASASKTSRKNPWAKDFVGHLTLLILHSYAYCEDLCTCKRARSSCSPDPLANRTVK